MTWVLGTDHRGIEYRAALAEYLHARGDRTIIVGATTEESYDYPLASDAVAHTILEGRAERGVLLCGTGIGVCIRANRYPGIRAATVWDEDSARLARLHNHANVVCMGASSHTLDECISMLSVFRDTPEDNDPRHMRRVKELDSETGSS